MIEEQFKGLVNQWRLETSHMSSTNDITSNSNYLEIISLGMPAVPLILNELKSHNESWYKALREITRENPVIEKYQGHYPEMAALWINLGIDRGWITNQNKELIELEFIVEDNMGKLLFNGEIYNIDLTRFLFKICKLKDTIDGELKKAINNLSSQDIANFMLELDSNLKK